MVNHTNAGHAEIKNCYSSGAISMHEDAMNVSIADISPYLKKTVINSFTAAQLDEFDKSERAAKLGDSFKEDSHDTPYVSTNCLPALKSPSLLMR